MPKAFVMSETSVAILSTKNIDEALINMTASKNIFIEVLSFIRTEPVVSVEVQQEIELAMNQYATVVFTSAQAVEIVFAELHDEIPDWKIFCISHATCDAATNYFGEQSIEGTADNAQDLAQLIIDRENVDELFFFCGDQRRSELPDLLSNHGIDVNEIVVYQTIATPHEVGKNYHGILFFSPSAVRSFFHKNKLKSEAVLFAIGNTTANEIRKFSKNKIIISDEPNTQTLLNEVMSYFSN